MNLSPSAWIYCGSGRLFGPPFVSRCLLYRLYDVNYSVLVYHKESVSSSYLRTESGTISFTAAVGEPDAIQAHLAPSARQNMNDMVKLPSTRFDLSGVSAIRRSLGEIVLIIESFLLPMKEMCIVGNDRGGSFEQKIANTAYCVKGSWPAVNLGTAGFFRCWKVSLISDTKSEKYGLESACDWSLTAVQDDDDWPPSIEMCLAKRS